jgi:hyperosmotically inducible protein
MSKVMIAALATTFALSLSSVQAQNYGSYNQSPNYTGNTPGNSQDQFYQNQGSNPSYYNQGQGSGQSYYNQGGNNPTGSSNYNQNQGSNPSYYNQSQGSTPSYYNQGSSSSNQGSSGYNSNPSNYQQSTPSQFNTDSNSTQPQSYNSKWGQNNRYTADANDKAASTDNKYPQDRAASDADRILNAKIRDKISGWFTDSYKNITLNTSNGVVTINGFVSSNDDLTKLLKEVRKVDGVRNVNNNVQIKQ